MPIVGALILPHPPLLLPEVGRGQENQVRATLDAYRRAAGQAADWRPDLLVLSSPHAPMYADYLSIADGPGGQWDMSTFGAPQVRLEADYDQAFREELTARTKAAGLPAGMLGDRPRHPDHGTAVPLYFLREAGVRCPLVRLGLSGLSPLEHYRLGQCVAEAANALGRRVVYVASGDLSHRLKEDGPYGFTPEGPAFDRAVTAALAKGDFLSLLTLDPGLCERAGECGLRSFQIMAGALDGLAVEAKLLSYQGTFGVGYAVAVLTPTGRDEGRRFARRLQEAEEARLAALRAAEDPWVRLARLSLETYVRTGAPLARLPQGLPGELTDRAAGAFVSLHLRGRLRGCIGTTGPTTGSVALEIVQNAVSAGTRDPRFPPVGPEELEWLEYSVDVLGEPEPVSSTAELDPVRYGVIVSQGGRRGLLLPDLEGVDTAEQQVRIARQKGGIGPGEPCSLERFKVVRHQ